MPDRSKGRAQTKRDTLVLQVGGWSEVNNLTQEKNSIVQETNRGKKRSDLLEQHGRRIRANRRDDWKKDKVLQGL
jgi:hypothetical protein